jgi:hypothetical protein
MNNPRGCFHARSPAAPSRAISEHPLLALLAISSTRFASRAVSMAFCFHDRSSFARPSSRDRRLPGQNTSIALEHLRVEQVTRL